MKLLGKIRKEVKVIFLILLAITGIALVEKKESGTICHGVQINVINPGQNNFVGEDEILKLVSGDLSVPLVGSPNRRISLKEIENRTESNLYIQEAQVSKDHKGNLLVDVYIARPIARILVPGKKDLYISDIGNLIETSARYTSRVLLISGPYADHFKENLKKDPMQKMLFDFLNYIRMDEFWNAQISQIDIDADGELTLYPQVSKQYIEFGGISGWEEKLIKLKIFYDKILPFKGWNTYSKVNLEFENQIICE